MSGVFDAARDVAIRALARQAVAWPDLSIAPLDSDSLGERDAAFAHAIYDAVLRRWITLAVVLESRLGRSLHDLEPRLRAVLLAGAAQLLLLDKVPAHAAIDTSVEWAKQRIRPGAGAMVNAVLRRVAELRCDDGEAAVAFPLDRRSIILSTGAVRTLREDVWPDDSALRLGAATSCPSWLVSRWVGASGEEEATRLCLHGLVHPPTVINAIHAERAVEDQARGLMFRPHMEPGHFIVSGPRGAIAEYLSRRNDLWVQDSASSRAVRLAAALRPGLIIDLCAGQGTKTRHLAAQFPDASILASDPDPARAATLRELAAAIPRIRVVEPQALNAQRGAADLILLDVPCTNTGVLPRRVEARYRCGDEQLARLVRTQREIIATAMGLVKPGGAILYSTCSLEREENEDQTEAMIAAGWRAEKVERTVPRGLPGEGPEQYRDGAFAALLRHVP